MPVEYSKLISGTQISDRSYVVDQETVSEYVAAVGDRSELSSDSDAPLVPPMAVAALSLRGVIDDLAIPGGTLHVGQELEFKSSVSIGETLRCRGTLAQNSIRAGWRFLVVELEVEDSQGESVMEGKSTITLPE